MKNDHSLVAVVTISLLSAMLAAVVAELPLPARRGDTAGRVEAPRTIVAPKAHGPERRSCPACLARLRARRRSVAIASSRP